MIYKLKAKRIEQGIKQKDFALDLGVSRQYLVHLESGKIEPRRDLMIKIAKKLNTSIDELFFSDK